MPCFQKEKSLYTRGFFQPIIGFFVGILAFVGGLFGGLPPATLTYSQSAALSASLEQLPQLPIPQVAGEATSTPQSNTVEYVPVAPDVSKSDVTNMLTLLEMKVRALIADIPPSAVLVPNPVPFSTFASSQKIDQLANVTLTNIAVSGVSGLTDADIPDSITVTSASTFPFTATTNFGAAVNSTSTPIWFTNGLQASSTISGTTFDSWPATSTILSYKGQSLLIASSTNFSTALGIGAGININTTGLRNTALGYQALLNATSTDDNVAVGSGALTGGASNFTGNRNVAIGTDTLFSVTTGSNNTAIGYNALGDDTTGRENIALGPNVLNSNTTGSDNVAIGSYALGSNITGSANIAIGSGALVTNDNGKNNTAIGTNAGDSIWLNADNNTLFGYNAGQSVTDGYANILLGAHVSTANVITTGSGNIGLGNELFFPSATANNQLNLGNFVFGTLPATSTAFRLPTTGALGIASSSPWATLSVHANNGFTNTALFAVGSSTASATTTHFVVTNAGKVGVGTTNPGAALEVVGDIISKGTAWTIRTSAADNGWYSVTYGNGLFVAVSDAGTGNRVMTSPDGITWTIRTSAADNGWYSVTYGNGLFVAVSDTGTGNRVMTSPDGITWTIRTSAANNSWRAVTYGNGLFVAVAITGTGNRVMTSGKTEQSALAHNNIYQGGMSILSGNVGIGTTTQPDGVNTRLVVSHAGQDGATWAFDGTAANNAIKFRNGNGQVGSIGTNGSATAYNTSSDRRIKDNIISTTLGLDTIMNLPVREFSFTSDATHATTTGFIAQELLEVFPWAVTTNGDNGTGSLSSTSTPWSVDYGRITPLLTRAIQDIASLSTSFKNTLISWLGDVDNGITDLFATTVYAKNVRADIGTFETLCVGSTCVTELQLQALLSGQGAAAASVSIPDIEEEADIVAPVISVNGNNPAQIAIRETYNDLGALVSDNRDTNIGIHLALDGVEVNAIQIDTTSPATYTITYSATDAAGNTAEAIRTVEVYESQGAVTAPIATSTDEVD